MINIKYTLNVETIEDKPLVELLDTKGSRQIVRNYSNIDGIRLISDNNIFISNAFKRSKVQSAKLFKRDGILYNQETTKESVNEAVEYYDIMEIEGLTTKAFHMLYGKYIRGKVLDGLTKNLTANDSIRVVRVLDDSVSKIDEDDYTVDLHSSSLTLEPHITDIDSLYYLVFKDTAYLRSVDNVFDISYDKLLHLNSDFYSILPKYYNNSKENSLELLDNKTIVIEGGNIFSIRSDVIVNFDNCSTDYLPVIGGSTVPVSYNEDFTPLGKIKSFSSEKEYIIFFLEGDTFKPKFHLTADSTDTPDDYTLLINSHEEFKRPYTVIANKASLVPITKDTDVSKLDEEFSQSSYVVTNTYFQTVLESNRNLIKVKI